MVLMSNRWSPDAVESLLRFVPRASAFIRVERQMIKESKTSSDGSNVSFSNV